MVRMMKPVFSTTGISWTFNPRDQGRYIFFTLNTAGYLCIILTMDIKKNKNQR